MFSRSSVSMRQLRLRHRIHADGFEVVGGEGFRRKGGIARIGSERKVHLPGPASERSGGAEIAPDRVGDRRRHRSRRSARRRTRAPLAIDVGSGRFSTAS